MDGMNHCTFIGEVDKDAELRTTQGGAQIATLTLVVKESFTDKQGNPRESKQYVNVVYWGGQAETAGTHAEAGDRVYVVGKMQTRAYEGNDGQKKRVTEVKGSTFGLMQKANQPQAAGQAAHTPVVFDSLPDDDIPF